MPSENNTINDWTIMFFFASDMELSPLTVSQIKAVKDAGYQETTDVFLYFDSNEPGVPTRLFNVNKSLKKASKNRTRIGDGADPYVRSFLNDEIMPDDMITAKGKCTGTLKQKLTEPDSMNATDALWNFLGYCQENSPAKHYLLFLVGHGMVVANDTFLYDEHPRSSITLNDFGDLIRRFTKSISETGTLELLGLHSCSMSSIEVAYELRDTARYMIASEGYSYVGSWPYRQLLKKIFNTTQNPEGKPLDELIQSIYELTLYNAPDFAYSGYSHDLTLCSLDGKKIARLVERLHQLTGNLKDSLKTDRGEQLILLAHLKSQAFWRDEYTDIYDFCRCLKVICDVTDASQNELAKACQDVMDDLEQRPDGLIVLSDNFGWQYQYAHGLSIYFPWIRPLGDEETGPFSKYQSYAFNSDFSGHTWDTFLEEYWIKTMRASEPDNEAQEKTMRAPEDRASEKEFERTEFDGIMEVRPSNLGFPSNPVGAYNKPGGGYNKPGGSMAESPCICPSIKNFPQTVKLNRRVRKVSATPGIMPAFNPTDESSERGRSRPEE